MSSSSHDTAVDNNGHQSKREDWADAEHDRKSHSGRKPSLQKQRSQEIHKKGGRPKTADSNDIEPHVSHSEYANRPRSPNQAPGDLHHHTAEEKSIRTHTSRKSQSEIDHHTTLTSIRTKIGLDAEAPIQEEHDSHEHLTWSSIRVIFREPFAEFFGTFVMILFGNGSVAQVLLSTGQETAPGGNGFGNYQSINWG